MESKSNTKLDIINIAIREYKSASYPGKHCSNNCCHMRVRGRESLVGQAAGRTTLPNPGAQSVRLTYHNIPVEMPPPPNARLMAEHSYTN